MRGAARLVEMQDDLPGVGVLGRVVVDNVVDRALVVLKSPASISAPVPLLLPLINRGPWHPGQRSPSLRLWGIFAKRDNSKVFESHPMDFIARTAGSHEAEPTLITIANSGVEKSKIFPF